MAQNFADLSIDEARAQIWINDVNSELELVRGVLKKTNTAITTIPTEDDTIFQGIRKVGQTLGNVWDKVCNAFDQSKDFIGKAIQNAATAGQELAEGAQSLATKFGG